MRDGFNLTKEPNPHILRGKQIIRAHPEVKEYFGPYAPTGIYIAAVVTLQIIVAALMRDRSWPVVILSAYLVGAFASHALFVLIHDASHNLIVKTSTPNRLFGILCNVGQGIPSAMSFRTYHLLHHSHLAEYDYDADLAFPWEARLAGRSPIRKALWLLLFPIIQILRPIRLRKAFVDRWIVLNFFAIAASDFLIWWSCGTMGLAYVLLSTFFGVGLHVLGARWVQEHYTFRNGQETYSYYGPLNPIAFNIGFHNEHHDLVRVPWVHLPKIKALAPEFYDHLYAHRSWTRVLVWFFFDPSVNLYTHFARRRAARLDIAA